MSARGGLVATDRGPVHPGLWLRYALRELRGGLRGFYVFIACIALGVMAIAGVGTVAASLADGLAREGRTLLGGDVALSLIQREANPDEMAFLAARGPVSTAATLRAMARTPDDRLTLVDVKAVDSRYPLVGAVTLAPAQPLAAALALRDGVHGAAVDATLLTRLGLSPGDVITIGDAKFVLRATILSEPDRIASGVGFGPRVMMSEEALRATGLLQPGSLVRWLYRVRLSDTADRSTVDRVAADARAAFPEGGFDIRTPRNISPQLERNLNRFTQFLSLVGMAALLIGGVGVANAVKSHLDRRHVIAATYKALGATGGSVFGIYLAQIMVVGAVGALIGVALGAALPFIIAGGFGHLLPLPIAPSLKLPELALAFLYGMLIALAFALWPLARAHDVPVSALFRDQIAQQWRRPRWRYLVTLALVALALIAVAIGLAYDRRIAAIFIAAAFAVFVVLRLVAVGVMALARRVPRPRSTMLRLALANIHRPGTLTPSVMLSLGLGLALLVTVAEIDANLRRQFQAELPDRAPSFYFVDIPSAEVDRFETFLAAAAPGASVERVPMLRGRIVAIGSREADTVKPSPDAEWVLQSDRGITYAADLPRGSRLVEGAWWPADYNGPPLVSFEKKLAAGLGLRLGDSVTVNVLGRNITATIANMRTVEWQGLGINFVMVFSPNSFRGAPHTHIATLTEPHPSAASDAAVVRAVADSFPSVTAVRVREVLESVGTVVANLVLAIRGASAITLLSAMLVLGGALAAGHRSRVYDAVILKTLGATRLRLLGAYALEYLMIGLAAALFGVLAGSLAAWLIVTQIMSLGFVWQIEGPLLMVALALAVTLGLGLAGTLVALSAKPAGVLRSL